jgi:CRISPR-associated protein Csx10
MLGLSFEIRALQPLLVARLEGDPNSAVSFPYVPGSALRGALANSYLQRHGGDLAADSKPRRLFFDGSTRYLNAYLLDRLGRPTLPAPRAWFYDKEAGLHDGTELYDAGVIRELGGDVTDYLTHPKGVGERFCRIERPATEDEAEDREWRAPEVEFTAPEWQVTVHTTRERRAGRATDEEGAVFRYQALAAGTRLSGTILASTPEDVKLLQTLLEDGDLWLGGSRSGGYGRVSIEGVETIEAGWSETGTPPRDVEPGAPVVITLLSNAVIRHGDGRYTDRLGPDLLPPPLDAALEPVAVFKEISFLGGFNRKWGLPLYQVPAIAAGSVFAFRAKAAIPTADLEALVAAGLGEGRAEGMGRVAVNWHPEEMLVLKDLERERPDAVPVTLSTRSRPLADTMVGRLLRRELDRLLEERLGSVTTRVNQPPTRAQLSRLRAIVLSALPDRDVERVAGFLQNLESRARDQYTTARIDGQRLLAWLEARLATPDEIWNWLSEAEIDLPRIGDVEAALGGDLAREYTLRAIDRVLHRAGKEGAHD